MASNVKRGLAIALIQALIERPPGATVVDVFRAHTQRSEDDPGCHALARMLCGVYVAALTCGLQRLARGDAVAAVAGAMVTEAERSYRLIELVPGGGR